MITTSRRSLITGLISLVAAPAIVRAESLMPVRALRPDGHRYWKVIGDIGAPSICLEFSDDGVNWHVSPTLKLDEMLLIGSEEQPRW